MALVVFGVVAALAIATIVILHFSPFQRGVADRVMTAIEAKTCLSIETESFEYRLWPAALAIRGISVSDPSGRSLTIESVDASWAWSQLIGGTPRIHHLAVEGVNADAFGLPMPCPNDDDGVPEADPWSAVTIDNLTISRAGVSGETADLAFSWTGLEAQATLVDQHLGLRMTAKSLHLGRNDRDLFVGPLELEVRGSPEAIHLKTLKITDGPLECEVVGSADGRGREAKAHVSGTVELREVLHWWDPSIEALVNPAGALALVADIDWNTDSGLQAKVRLDGRPLGLAGYTFSRLETTYMDGRLTAEAADPSWGRAETTMTPDGFLEVKVRLDGADPVPALTLAQIKLPETAPQDGRLSGDFQARMSLPMQLDRITGTADLEARWKGGRAHLRGSAGNGIVVDQAEIEVFGAKAVVSGTVALDGNINLKGTGTMSEPGKTIAHLSTFFPELGALAVDGGPLGASIRLSGTVTAPRIDANIHWEAPGFEGNRLENAFATVQGTADDIDWTTTLEADGGRLFASGTASVQSATMAGNWQLEAPDLGALQLNSVMADEPEIAGSITGNGNFSVDTTGWRASALLDGHEIHAQGVTIPHLMVEAQADPNCVSIDTLTAEVLGGHIEGAGTLCPAGLDGEIQATMQWSSLDPSQVLDTLPEAARGLISGRLNIKGPLSDPAGSALLSWEAAADDAPLERAGVQAHLENGLVTVVSDRLESISGPLTLRADLPMGDVPRPNILLPTAPSGPWRVNLNGHDLALAPLLATLDREDLEPGGSFDLDLRASWHPDRGGLPQIHLEIAKFEMAIAGRRITAQAPIRLALDERGVVVADVNLKGDLNRLIMGGSYALKTEEIDASINGSLDPDLALLSPVPLTIDQPITIKGRIEGPAGAWVGHFTLDHEGGSIEMRDPPMEITDASLEARWQDGILEITAGSAQVNRGSITLGGAWDPESGQGIIAEMADVTALLPGGIVTRWDGVIALEPASDRLMTVAGDLSLKYGVWDYPFDLGAAVRGVDDEAVPGADDITHRIGLDVEVRGGGGITVDNNLGQFGVRWNVLEIGGTVAQPRIMGDLNLLPGGVLMAAGQPIKIRRGLVQFTGDPLTDPLLEVIPEDLGSTTSWDLDASGDTMQQQASSMAAAGLASGLGAVFGLENTTIRPEEIAMETDEDTSTDFSIGQQLSHNTALFLTTDLRDSQKRTTLLQLWRLPSFPGLTLQAMSRTDPGEADFKLLQRFSWGGTLATGEQPRLHKVRLEGDWPWSKRKLRKATGLVRDQPWDPFFLFLGDIRLEKKLTEEGWPEARVDSRVEGPPERPIAVFTCSPGRHVEFTFEGDSIGKTLKSSLRPLYRFPPFERAALAEMGRLATRHLWAAGHPEATVDIVSDGEGQVVVSADQGPEKTLRGPMLEGVPDAAVPSLTVLLGQPTELTEISKDPTRAERIVRRTLATAGYRDVRSVESWTETTADGVIEVHLRVDPGALAHAVRVDLVGDDPLGLTDSQDFAIRSNMVLERGTIDKAVASLRRSYRKEGFTQVRVRSQIYRYDDQQWAVLLTLDPGSTAVVDRIEITGRRHLSERAILKNLPVQPDELFLLDDLDDSVARLATFEPVERVTATTRPDADRVVVDLDIIEKARWTGEIGGGWNSDRGATARVGLNDNNLFRRGFRLGLRGRLEQDFLQGRIILALPPLPGGRFSASLNASYTEDVLPAEFEGDIVINENIRGAALEGHYRLKPGLWTRGYYRFTRTRTFEEEPFDPDFPLDITQDLAVLGGQIVVDRLDNPFDPRHGHYLALDLSWAGEAIGSDKENIRSLLTGSLASEPRGGWTWFQSLRLGAAKPLNGVLDRQSRFFAGGSASIRGFKLDSVGPVETLGGVRIYAGGEALFVLNEELRFPLWQAFRGAVFIDTGQVWETWSDADFDLSVGAGLGLRWSTPVGPLWVDAAWPVVNPGENSGARYSFGIGRTF
jgi:outer membrane translocation and assembly module TamA